MQNQEAKIPDKICDSLQPSESAKGHIGTREPWMAIPRCTAPKAKDLSVQASVGVTHCIMGGNVEKSLLTCLIVSEH